MKSFTFYEQVGVVIPGAVFLIGVVLLAPNANTWIEDSGVTVGDLGLFLVLAYAAGHAVAAVGNVLESIFWFPFGGRPSVWVTSDPPRLMNATQVAALVVAAKSRLGVDMPNPTKLPKEEWEKWFGQLYRDVLSRSPGRIETFNGNYGLNRGLAAATLLLIPIIVVMRPSNMWWWVAGAGVLTLIYLYRMYRFGVHFGSEAFFCFLNPLSSAKESEVTKE